MNEQSAELFEKMRQQFNAAPYPNIPLEENPKDHYGLLYNHNFTTAYYLRNQRVPNTHQSVILDAGCGSGFKSLVLAEANPGAKIVGIDLSEESIRLAKQRLQYYGFENAEFYAVSIEEMPKLGMEFDYINCDEVLYLLPNPVVGLQAMKAVLKPDGIIRANFHSSIQRYMYLGGQKFFGMLGLMDDAPQKDQIATVREVMKALKPSTLIKQRAWAASFETEDEKVTANYLLHGDKGWTIPEFFAALRATDLEFINMLEWRQWDLLNLFENIEELPVSVALSLAEKSMEEQLHISELLHPIHRLLDLLCGHLGQAQAFIPVAEWGATEWQSAIAHLHPQIRTPIMKENLITCLNQLKMFDIGQYVRPAGESVTIDSLMAGCLLPLMDSAQPVSALVQRWQQLRPIHPVTMAPTQTEEAFELIYQLLAKLEDLGYVLLECV